MKLRLFKESVFALSIVSLFTLPAKIAHAAAPSCAEVFRSGRTSTTLNPLDPQQNQSVIARYAQKKGLPAFTITTAAGKHLPVVLLNKKTIGEWSEFLRQTLGLNQSLHSQNAANHGWVRLPGPVQFEHKNVTSGLFENGSPDGVLVDLFSPGQSHGQAINGNGYRWKPMSEYFKRRHENSFVHIEQAFALSREEQTRFWLYQLVKRASIVRIQYIFDTHNNEWIRNQRRVLQQDGEFNRRGCGEHCNNSRVGAQAEVHVREMRGRMVALFNRDVDGVYQITTTQAFIERAERKLLSADWQNETQLRPDILDDPDLLELLSPVFVPNLTHDQKVDAASYLFAAKVFEDAVAVKEKYQINEDVAMGFGETQVSALFVYSDLADSPELFFRGAFEYLGANGAGFSSSWNGFEPQSLFRNPPKNWQRWQP